MTKLNFYQEVISIKDASEKAGDRFDDKDYKRNRHGGKDKFNYKSRKRPRRHTNNRLANQEYRKHSFDW